MSLCQPWPLNSTLTSSLPKADFPPGPQDAGGCMANSVINVIVNWQEV